MIVEHIKQQKNETQLPKYEQLFLKSRIKENEQISNVMDSAYTFAPVINNKTDEILAHSSLPKEFMNRQKMNTVMTEKKMKMLKEIYGNSFCPKLVSQYRKKLNVV